MSTLFAFASLAGADRRLVFEAAARIGLIRLLMCFVTVPRVVALISPRRAGSPNADAPSVERVAWAVGAVGRRLAGASCLVQALAAWAMLRRRGYDAAIRIGARRQRPALEAHAWVECGGIVVVGGLPDLEDYAVLA